LFLSSGVTMTARTPDREVRPGITVRDAEDAIAASLAGQELG
jgi:hypothetical protein